MRCSRSFFPLIALILAPCLSQATDLDVQGAVSTLVGGTSDAYYPIDWYGATSTDVMTGSARTSDTAGPYEPGGANLHADASASSTARFGWLSEASRASGSGYTAYAYGSLGGNSAYALDNFVVHGTGPIEITLYALLTGDASISDDGAGARVRAYAGLSPWGRTDNSQVTTESFDYSGPTTFSTLMTSSIFAVDGDGFNLYAGVQQTAAIQALDFTKDIQAQRVLSASTQADLHYWIGVSGGGSFTTVSGAKYAAAVPTPPTWSVMGFGLALLKIRRRKNRA